MEKRSLLLLFIVIDPVGWFALSYVEGFDTAVYCRFCQSIFDPRCRVGVFYTEPKLINILLINSLGHSIIDIRETRTDTARQRTDSSLRPHAISHFGSIQRLSNNVKYRDLSWSNHGYEDDRRLAS